MCHLNTLISFIDLFKLITVLLHTDCYNNNFNFNREKQTKTERMVLVLVSDPVRFSILSATRHDLQFLLSSTTPCQYLSLMSVRTQTPACSRQHKLSTATHLCHIYSYAKDRIRSCFQLTSQKMTTNVVPSRKVRTYNKRNTLHAVACGVKAKEKTGCNELLWQSRCHGVGQSGSLSFPLMTQTNPNMNIYILYLQRTFQEQPSQHASLCETEKKPSTQNK